MSSKYIYALYRFSYFKGTFVGTDYKIAFERLLGFIIYQILPWSEKIRLSKNTFISSPVYPLITVCMHVLLLYCLCTNLQYTPHNFLKASAKIIFAVACTGCNLFNGYFWG